MITFDASQFQGFVLDLSDREIYNDIRAECDITEILTIRPDATPEFFETKILEGYPGNQYGRIEPTETEEVNIYAESGDIGIVWLDAWIDSYCYDSLIGLMEEECLAINPDAHWYLPYGPKQPSMSICSLPDSSPTRIKTEFDILHRADTYMTVSVTNLSDYAIRCTVKARCLALTPEKRYIKLRSINEISQRKYGRRTMDKPWPLGIHPTMMQSLIDGDCVKYSEPVCMASITIQGTTNDLIEKILNLKIDDKHEFVHPGLNMTEQFFITNLDVHHDINSLLEGTFDLEQVRDIERTKIWKWDESTWDDGDVWG